MAEARERGFRVLSARAGQAETVLTYAALADLLGGVESEILAGLPEVHRIAVDRVLLRATAASQAVLAAGARRFTGRVGLLITERTEHEGAGAATWLQLVRPTAWPTSTSAR